MITTSYSYQYSFYKKIYLCKEWGYQNNSFKSFHYYLLVLGVTVSTKQLPCGYSTKKISSLTNCDLYNTTLKDEYQAEVFICEHGYHTIYYNLMKRKCKYCYEYYETVIKHNLKSFINRLEKEANILTNEDIDIDNNNNKGNNNSTDKIKNLNLILSKKDKIEQ